jgi:prevent-host-death family protein
MTITKISSRDFNQDIGKAKRAATEGPVIITDRGEPAHVLLSIAQYQELTGGTGSIVDLLGDARAAEIEFSPPRVADSSLKVPDISQ